MVVFVLIILIKSQLLLSPATLTFGSVWIIILMLHVQGSNCIAVWNEFAKMAHASKKDFDKSPWLPNHKYSRRLVLDFRLFDGSIIHLCITFLFIEHTNFSWNHHPIIFYEIRKLNHRILMNFLNIYWIWVDLINKEVTRSSCLALKVCNICKRVAFVVWIKFQELELVKYCVVVDRGEH